MQWTDGNALIATGSPFSPVDHDGVRHVIAQSNNALIFPGLGLGVSACHATRITEGMTEYRCGDLVGYGLSEYLDQIVDGRPDAITMPEWLRTLVHSGLSDGLIPTRYFALVRERLFPRLLRGRIVPTRQEVFFFGAPAGDRRFGADALPAWIDFPGGVYGLPDLETRGVKLAFDRHGPAFDPERGSREVSPASVAAARRALAARFGGQAFASLEALLAEAASLLTDSAIADREAA